MLAVTYHLFPYFKRIKLIVFSIGTIGFLIMLGNIIIVFMSSKSKILINLIGMFVGFIPGIVLVVLVYNNAEAYIVFAKDTENIAMQNQKFEACFDNIKESIILISNGQIEYVNSKFLYQFKGQIDQYEECVQENIE